MRSWCRSGVHNYAAFNILIFSLFLLFWFAHLPHFDFFNQAAALLNGVCESSFRVPGANPNSYFSRWMHSTPTPGQFLVTFAAKAECEINVAFTSAPVSNPIDYSMSNSIRLEIGSQNNAFSRVWSSNADFITQATPNVCNKTKKVHTS